MKAIACADTVSNWIAIVFTTFGTYSYERQCHIDDELGELLSLKVLGLCQQRGQGRSEERRAPTI